MRLQQTAFEDSKKVKKMSSKALKMKKNLEKIKRDRKMFEEKMNQLDAEMTKGRVNMSKIKIDLKNNEVTASPIKEEIKTTAAAVSSGSSMESDAVSRVNGCGSSSLGSSLKVSLNLRKLKASTAADQNNKASTSGLAEPSSGILLAVKVTETTQRSFLSVLYLK